MTGSRRGTARALFLGALVVFVAGGASGALAWKWIGRSSPKPAVGAASDGARPAAAKGAEERSPADGARARHATRPADAIVKEFKSIKTPGFGNGLSEDEFDRVIEAAFARQNALASELFESYPRDPRVEKLLHTRWCNLLNGMERASDVLREAEEMLGRETEPAVHALAVRMRAQASLDLPSTPVARLLEWIELAKTTEPVDHETSGYFHERFAERWTADPVEQRRHIELARASYAKAKRSMDGTGFLERTLKRLGRELTFEFDDVLGTGTWRRPAGRRVLVHLWSAGHYGLPANAPDPDVADLKSALPSLRAAGVEVIAVSDAGHMGSRGDPAQSARDQGVTWPFAVGTRGDDPDDVGPGGYSSFLWIDEDGRAAAWCRRLGPLLEHAGINSR